MSNGKPKISVLMPVYNAEKFLREAIESILGQSFRFFEFIIVNDKSTDASKKIILSYSDSRIRYLENKKNLGVAGALNVGLEQTRCSLIARMDADDISLPDRFALQHAEMSKNKDVVVIASNFDIINEEGKLLFQNRHCITPEEIYYSLHFRNCLCHPTVMFRKEIILKMFGGYNVGAEAEDYELWLRLLNKYRLAKIPRSLLKLRVSKKSRMGSGSIISREAISRAKVNLENLIGEKIDDATIEILYKMPAIYGSNSPLEFSPVRINKALGTLNTINRMLLLDHPAFINTTALRKIMAAKTRSLRLRLLTSLLFSPLTIFRGL